MLSSKGVADYWINYVCNMVIAELMRLSVTTDGNGITWHDCPVSVVDATAAINDLRRSMMDSVPEPKVSPYQEFVADGVYTKGAVYDGT